MRDGGTRTFDARAYTEAVTKYNQRWGILDSALYRVCREHPDHSDIAAVIAKVFLIGRAYQTGIERQMTSDGSQAGVMEALAEHLWSHAREVDELFGPVRGVESWDGPDTVQDVASAHAGLLKLLTLMPTLRKNRTPRSFVSKYLHFHAPIAPIYDALAVEAIGTFVLDTARIPPAPEGEKEYVAFLRRFVALESTANGAGVAVTSKRLDHYLLSLVSPARAQLEP